MIKIMEVVKENKVVAAVVGAGVVLGGAAYAIYKAVAGKVDPKEDDEEITIELDSDETDDIADEENLDTSEESDELDESNLDE